MALTIYLQVGAMGLPLLVAFGLWRWGNRIPHAQRRLTAMSLGLVGLAALGVFLGNGLYACIVASGQQNCLFDGVSTLSLAVVCTLFVWGALVLREGDRKGDYILMLTLTGAWAGLAFAQNLLELIVFLNLFIYVMYRWLKRNGTRWGLFVVWPDHDDGHN